MLVVGEITVVTTGPIDERTRILILNISAELAALYGHHVHFHCLWLIIPWHSGEILQGHSLYIVGVLCQVCHYFIANRFNRAVYAKSFKPVP